MSRTKQEQDTTTTALATQGNGNGASSMVEMRAMIDSLFGEVDEETRAALVAGQQDIRPTTPFASIRQKQTDDDNILGGLKFNDDRPDLALPHAVLVLAGKSTRVCWDRSNLQAPPRCKSINGINRLDDAADPGIKPDGTTATLCQDCIRRLWPKERLALAERYFDRDFLCPPMTGKEYDDRPECGQVMNLLCCEPDGSDFWIMSLHGSAMKPTNSYLGRFTSKGLPTFVAISEISTEFVRTSKGSYYVPKWRNVGATPREIVAQLVHQYKTLMDNLVRDAARFDEIMERDWSEAAEEGSAEPTRSGESFPDVFENQ